MSENEVIEPELSEQEKESKFIKFVKGKGVMNLPNQLTILRVLLIPLFVVFFYVQFKGHYFVALGVFAVASFTDFLDGYLARKYKLITNLGKFLDPVADKILVSAAMILMLTKPEFFITVGDWALICAGCSVALILARELMVSGFRMVAASTGMVIAADKVGKVKTVCQMVSLLLLLLWAGLAEFIPDLLFTQIVNYVGLALFALATLLTVISGINYIIKNIEVLKK
ncbi:MAG: CDP-diacylglycerol--glycerol-3-phosphate 3-phosphatidyltransferase [Candidatus Coproplasma sp.]